MSSVQVYTLRDNHHHTLLLRRLETRLPLQCKQMPQQLTSLEAHGVLQDNRGKSDVLIVLDPDTLHPIVKRGGDSLEIQQDAEWLRLQQFLVRCWINLLKAHETQRGALHSEALRAARQALKSR